ncbi:MAG: N-acetyltransferase [Bacteroidia bacterium]|nr:N-acetyltransferase [Bacteroidia bacterium]
MGVKIRKATVKDVEQIMDIYNWAIETTTGTFDTENKTYENRVAWFTQRDPQFCVYVAEYEKELTITGINPTNSKEVAGFASLNKWSERAAYDITPEVSMYVQPEYQGQGIGQLLLAQVIADAKASKKIVSILARITQGNKPSILIHKKFGFKETGVLEKAGIKFDKYLDVIFMQLML